MPPWARAAGDDSASWTTAGQDRGPELLHQTGRLQRGLPVVVVDVEHAALRAGVRGALRLVHDGLDAVDLKDAGEGEAAEPGADDGDWCVHG